MNITPNNISTTRAAMADEESMLNSAATSSSTRNWLPGIQQVHVHATALSSWDIKSTNPNWNPQNPNSSYSSCEEDISMPTSALLSGITMHPTGRFDGQGCVSTAKLMEEDSADNHLWNHVFT